MLKRFIKDTAYFQTRRDINFPIKASDLDKQFDNLTNFINKKLVRCINEITTGTISGDDEKLGTFFCNNYGGKVELVKITDDNLAGKISMSKFKGTLMPSVIASNKDGKLNFAVASPDTVFTNTENGLRWEKLTGGNFKEKSIRDIKIDNATLDASHLSQDIILSSEIDPGSILNRYIKQGVIENAKIAPNTYDDTRIHDDLMTQRNQQPDTLRFKEKSISARNIADRGNNNGWFIWSNYAHSFKNVFSSENIADNSVVLNNIDPLCCIGWDVIRPYHIQDQSVDVSVWADYNLTWKSYGFTSIGKAHLSPALRKKLGL